MQNSPLLEAPSPDRPFTPPPVIDDASVLADERSVEETAIVSIGGGLGSFALADSLRVAGAPKGDIAVISTNETPIDTYESRVSNSGIDADDRLRSDSCSTLDNLWGFPGYAIREALRERSLGPAMRIIGEPLVSDYYTPRAGDVYRSVRTEARRIGWADMLRPGHAEWVRPMSGGGYVTCYRSTTGERRLVRSNSVHLACGAGPLRIPADSADFRARYPDDHRLRHVYEPESELLPRADGQPLAIVVRGDGIAAYHAIDSLLLRHHGAGLDLRIFHLQRPRARRSLVQACGSQPVRQAFNVPKSAWGGQLHHRLRAADQAGKDRLLEQLVETNTPARRGPTKRLRRAIAADIYRRVVADVETIDLIDDRLVIRLESPDEDEFLVCDHLIDATGLDAGATRFPLVADLMTAHSVEPTAYGRVPIAPTFAATGLESGTGNVYISGSLAFGSEYAAPDTFLGLQFAAMAIHDDLSRRGHAPRLSTRRSIVGWWHWMRGERP